MATTIDKGSITAKATEDPKVFLIVAVESGVLFPEA